MSGPYTPQQPRHNQVVRSRRGTALRWQWWWLVPVIGLVPLIVAVLATQGAFNRRETPPVASGTTVVQATLAPTTAQPASGPTASATAAAEPAAGQPSSNAPAPNPTNGAAASPTSGVATSPTSGVATSPTSGVATTPTSGGATAATTSTSASASSAYIAYTVKAGDTVHFIARAYGVSTASIIQASGLSNPDLLRVGQVLTIPAGPGWLYRVQPGETLDQIAARTGVASDQIASASGLTVASVDAGDVLLIPEQSADQSK